MNSSERFKRDINMINKYFENISQENLNKDLEECGINYIDEETFGKVTFKVEVIYNLITSYNSCSISNYSNYYIVEEDFKRCKLMNRNQIIAA